MLSVYLKRVLVQTEWNDTFLQFLYQIGEIHSESDHSVPTNVNYIHINALMGYLEHLLLDIIWNTESFDSKRKHAAIKAINKFFSIQNDFFTLHYGISIKLEPIDDSSPKKQMKCIFK
jgi:hypothetical protein